MDGKKRTWGKKCQEPDFVCVKTLVVACLELLVMNTHGQICINMGCNVVLINARLGIGYLETEKICSKLYFHELWDFSSFILLPAPSQLTITKKYCVLTHWRKYFPMPEMTLGLGTDIQKTQDGIHLS